MRVIGNKVYASENDCEKFADGFPCSHFSYQNRKGFTCYIRVMAEFQGESLVDLQVYKGQTSIDSELSDYYPDQYALLCLVNDMNDYWSKK